MQIAAFTVTIYLCDELVGLVSKKLSRALGVKKETVDFLDIGALNLDSTVGCSNNFGGSKKLHRETERCSLSKLG